MVGVADTRRPVPSITNDEGHYSDSHDIIPGHGSVAARSSGHRHYQYIDIGQVNAAQSLGAGQHATVIHT